MPSLFAEFVDAYSGLKRTQGQIEGEFNALRRIVSVQEQVRVPDRPRNDAGVPRFESYETDGEFEYTGNMPDLERLKGRLEGELAALRRLISRQLHVLFRDALKHTALPARLPYAPAENLWQVVKVLALRDPTWDEVQQALSGQPTVAGSVQPIVAGSVEPATSVVELDPKFAEDPKNWAEVKFADDWIRGWMEGMIEGELDLLRWVVSTNLHKRFPDQLTDAAVAARLEIAEVHTLWQVVEVLALGPADVTWARVWRALSDL